MDTIIDIIVNTIVNIIVNAIVDIIVDAIIDIIVDIIVNIIVNFRAIVVVKIKYKNNKVKATFLCKKGKIRYSKLRISFGF